LADIVPDGLDPAPGIMPPALTVTAIVAAARTMAPAIVTSAQRQLFCISVPTLLAISPIGRDKAGKGSSPERESPENPMNYVRH